MSASAQPEVKLVVGSLQLTRWKSYEVESDLLTPADAFHFVAANVDGELAGLIRPEDQARVIVDGTAVMVGNVDDVAYEVSDEGSSLEISGRDRGRFLVDCSATPIALKGQTLKSLAEHLAGDWIPVWQTSGSIALPQVKKMKVDPGETVLDCLNRFAAPAKALIWLDEAGRGVIGRPSYSQKPLYSLFRFKGTNPSSRKNNVLRGRVVESSRDQFSSVTVLASCANSGSSLFGKGASKLRGLATDYRLPNWYKPKVMAGTAVSTAQAKLLAEEEVQRAQFHAWKAEYTVPGHYNSKELWRTNTLCTLVDELAGIDGGTYFVSRRRFSGGEQGSFTEVELHPAGVYLA